MGTKKQRQDWGAKVRAARKALGLTQAGMAVHLDVHVSTVCKWEQGRALPHRMFKKRLEGIRE